MAHETQMESRFLQRYPLENTFTHISNYICYIFGDKYLILGFLAWNREMYEAFQYEMYNIGFVVR